MTEEIKESVIFLLLAIASIFPMAVFGLIIAAIFGAIIGAVGALQQGIKDD